MNSIQKDGLLLRASMRGECAAADCYRWASRWVHPEAISQRKVLLELACRHERRSRWIHQYLTKNNDRAYLGAGLWGIVTLLVLRVVALNGCGAGRRVLSFLLEGEKFGLCQYESQILELSEEARKFVQDEVLGPQFESLEILTHHLALNAQGESRASEEQVGSFPAPLHG